MLILKLAFRNLARHLRKTILLGSLIAVGMAALFVANAVFESTNSGLEASFVRSLTGDAALAANGEMAFSLFGSEVPIVAEYESIPPIDGYARIAERLGSLNAIEAFTPVVSGAAQIRIGAFSSTVPIFGVDPTTYFEVCSDIGIVRGDVNELSVGGVFINENLARSIESSLGRVLVLGDEILFGMYSNGSFRIKKGRFSGVHRYVGANEALDRVVLVDATIVRSIANYTLGFAAPDSASDDSTNVETEFDLDSLFTDAMDIEADADEGLTLDSVESVMSETIERDRLVQTDAAAWSFALLRAKEGRRSALVRQLRRFVRDYRQDLRVLTWRAAAGATAQALFAIQAAFYVGLGFVALGAVLVIMNALVISVLERSGEIGTMRSLGAGTPFITKLFIAESMALTMISSFIGVLVGVTIVVFLASAGISIENPLLISLFGGAKIAPTPSLISVVFHLALAAVVGAIAWVYPVSLAMRIQPITAMNGS